MPDRNSKTIERHCFGLTDYADCLASQRRMHQDVVDGGTGKIIFVEHPPTLTLGKNASREHLLFDTEAYVKRGISVQQIERGGEVTAHEPGQLVVYPILKLSDHGLTPRKYIELLENTVIAVLDKFGVRAHTDPEYPGVWVGREKICAVGVRIKQRVSLHGIALNVNNNLQTFQMITPCGIAGRQVCRLQDLVSPCPDIQTVIVAFGDEFAKRLEVEYQS